MRSRPRQIIFAGHFTDRIRDMGSEQVKISKLAGADTQRELRSLDSREKGASILNKRIGRTESFVWSTS